MSLILQMLPVTLESDIGVIQGRSSWTWPSSTHQISHHSHYVCKSPFLKIWSWAVYSKIVEKPAGGAANRKRCIQLLYSLYYVGTRRHWTTCICPIWSVSSCSIFFVYITIKYYLAVEPPVQLACHSPLQNNEFNIWFFHLVCWTYQAVFTFSSLRWVNIASTRGISRCEASEASKMLKVYRPLNP
jgi:hypothetical protein